jgi:hypothetical protein
MDKPDTHIDRMRCDGYIVRCDQNPVENHRPLHEGWVAYVLHRAGRYNYHRAQALYFKRAQKCKDIGFYLTAIQQCVIGITVR